MEKKHFKRSAALLHLGYLNQNSHAWFSDPTFHSVDSMCQKLKKTSRLRHPAVLEKGVVHIFELWRWISKVKHAPEVLAERDFWSEIHPKKGAQLHFNHFHCKKMASPIKTPKRIRSTNHQATTRSPTATAPLLSWRNALLSGFRAKPCPRTFFFQVQSGTNHAIIHNNQVDFTALKGFLFDL